MIGADLNRVCRLMFDGERVNMQTPAELEMEDGDQIELILEQQGGKPVIRLYSAHGLEGVSVALTLCEWYGELLYPQPAISGVCSYILWLQPA